MSPSASSGISFLFSCSGLRSCTPRLTGTVQISIQHTHTRTHPRHGHRQVGSGGGFTHAAFARGHGDDIFHAFNGRHAGLHFVRGNFGGDLDMQAVCLFMLFFNGFFAAQGPLRAGQLDIFQN